ncbi:unnamed protein product, partial [Vitis vinifera]|uniref:Uncharacterized protein n=1 Tax=Vitis vinifera TaxID=29760 RepID=D7SZ56_VITVI
MLVNKKRVTFYTFMLICVYTYIYIYVCMYPSNKVKPRTSP